MDSTAQFTFDYQSSDSDTVCASGDFANIIYNAEGGNHPQALTTGKLSEKSSLTRIYKYINASAYIERPYEESIQEFNESDDFDSKTFPCSDNRCGSSPFSGSATKMQLCKVIDDPEVIRMRQERYNQWLRNKRAMEAKKRREAQRKAEEEQAHLDAKRKRSQEKVQQWMEKHCNGRGGKNSENRNSGNVNCDPQRTKTQQMRKKVKDGSKYEEWMNKKKQQEKAEQEKQQQERRLNEQFQEYRQSLSNAYYRKWCDVSREKPRPVPLNRGFRSLAPSTTSLYINPYPWQLEL